MDDVYLLDDIDDHSSHGSRQRNFYERRDPLNEYNEQEFRRDFRMTKASFCRLLDIVSPLINESSDPRATSVEMQLLIALRFYAVDTFHYVSGELLGFPAGHVCTVVARVSAAIASLFPHFISFPSNEELKKVAGILFSFSELTSVAQHHAEFEKIRGFPGVFGLIDGTHVRVQVPAAVRSRFYDRKSNTSLNIQVVVSHDMKIIDFVNRWPGSAHDSRIFHSSSLYCRLESDPPEGHLLGVSGYPNYPYLLTPLRSGMFSPAELAYQTSHCATRNLIERTFGCWKSKFQCLKFLRLKMSTSLDVVTACAVIWNFLLSEKETPEESPEPDEYAGNSTTISDTNAPARSSDGQQKRRMLIDSYFSNFNGRDRNSKTNCRH